MRRLALTVLALILALGLARPALAAVDELAFGTSPQVMVFLFVLDEVSKMPDSPYTAQRVDSAVKFCRGKISEWLVDDLVEIQRLIKGKKFKQAQAKAKDLLAMTYGE